jgi:hypothetical protein
VIVWTISLPSCGLSTPAISSALPPAISPIRTPLSAQLASFLRNGTGGTACPALQGGNPSARCIWRAICLDKAQSSNGSQEGEAEQDPVRLVRHRMARDTKWHRTSHRPHSHRGNEVKVNPQTVESMCHPFQKLAEACSFATGVRIAACSRKRHHQQGLKTHGAKPGSRRLAQRIGARLSMPCFDGRSGVSHHGRCHGPAAAWAGRMENSQTARDGDAGRGSSSAQDWSRAEHGWTGMEATRSGFTLPVRDKGRLEATEKGASKRR